MEEEKMVEAVEKATEDIIVPSITAKKMNGIIVAAAAAVGLTIGRLAMWLVPKAVRGIGGFFKKKGKKEEEDITAELDSDDEEEFFDEP